MEAAPAFDRPRPAVKTENPARDRNGDGDSPSKQHLLGKMGNSCGKQELETDDKTSSTSNHNDLSCTKLQGDELELELESARAEMGEVREENQRLKTSLSKIMKDYEALKMQFLDIMGGEADKSPEKADESELISLTLGRFPTTEIKNKKSAQINELEGGVNECLSLGLNCKFEGESTAVVKETASPNQSLTSSFDRDRAKEDVGETSKAAKTMRSSDDDVASQNPPKRARVCVRARCETATMNDGCQWRKYGQKISKGNPCPRAYYRCTGSSTCPVRKQVQRCVDDMSVLVTTYEGTHNHQLLVSATAMASTTSAAASMLLSGSTTSAAAANLHGLNYYLSSNNTTNSNSKPNFYLPNNPSIISSTPPTHPTITLDLTSNPSSSSNSSTHFGKFASTTFNNSRYPFTSQLDFGSSRNNVLSWNNGLFSYNNKNNNISATTTNNIYQNYIQQQQRNGNINNHHNVAVAAPSLSHQHQQHLPDTIAAAAKAITTDPSFQSALVAALASIIGTDSRGDQGVVKPSMTTKGEQPLFQLMSTTTMTNKGNGCGTSFLSNVAVATGTGTGTANNSTTGNMVFVSESSMPFSKPKSMPVSVEDHIDLTN